MRRNSGGLRAGQPRNRGWIPEICKRFFRFSAARCDVRLAVKPTRLTGGWVPGRVKRSGREAEHSPSPSAQVKITWKYMHHLP